MAPVFDLEEDEEVDTGDAVEEVWRFLVEETGGEVEDGLLEGFETVEGDSGVDSGRPIFTIKKLFLMVANLTHQQPVRQKWHRRYQLS